MWVDTDIAEPSYNDQIVKVKVNSLMGSYTTYAWYNHEDYSWYIKDGVCDGACLDDLVYRWKMPLLKHNILLLKLKLKYEILHKMSLPLKKYKWR